MPLEVTSIVCAVCRIDRSLDAFSTHPRTGDPDPTCLNCTLTCSDCRATKLASEFPRHRNRYTGRMPYCKPCHNARGKASVTRRHGGYRHYRLEAKYGIGAADVDAMIADQGGLCAVCLERPAVHVDHDHKAGKVRGIVCEPCNGMMGLFKDDPRIIASAIVYLEEHRARKGGHA